MLTHTSLGWFLALLLPIFDSYLLCLLAYLLRKIKLNYLLMVCLVSFCSAEIFVIIFNHSTISPQIIQLFMETNLKESSEFIQSALFSYEIWQSMSYTLLLIGISVLLAKWCHKHPLPTLVSWIGMALILWSGIRQVSSYSKLIYCFQQTSLSVIVREKNIPRLNSPGVRYLYGMVFCKVASKEIVKLEQTVAETQVAGCSFKSPLIVLIIGESYNKHHTPLYNPGYLPTTPRLSTRAKTGNLVVFSDAVSPSNLTTNVFKYMFSTWDDTCEDDWTQHTLFPAVFIKAGYQVHFLTNQFIYKAKESHDFAGETIFNSTVLSHLQFTTHNEQKYKFDGELLAEIPPMEKLTEKPTLLIVHLIGQHVDYFERYPKEHSVFRPEDEQTAFGKDTGKRIAAAYDNAVHYNDWVVDSIFRTFQEQDAICLYLADHGEEAYDWRDEYCRSSESEITQEIARNQYEIPMMVYMTDSFKTVHPEVAERVILAKDRPFISTDLCQTLFYLAGIQTKEYREKQDVLSPNYDMKRKRIIRFDTDYDALMKP